MSKKFSSKNGKVPRNDERPKHGDERFSHDPNERQYTPIDPDTGVPVTEELELDYSRIRHNQPDPIRVPESNVSSAVAKTIMAAGTIIGAVALYPHACSSPEPEFNDSGIPPGLQKEITIDDLTIRRGDTARVPGWQWVHPLNVDELLEDGDLVTIRDSNSDYGHTCGIKTGGKLTVIGVNPEFAVLHYKAAEFRGGTQCPSDIAIALPLEEFASFSGKYMDKMEATAMLKKQVRAVLEGKAPQEAGTTDSGVVFPGFDGIVPGAKWVDVVNLKPVNQEYTNATSTLQFQDTGDFDTCILETGGAFKVLGYTSNNLALVRYTAPGRAGGTQCPTGILYLADPAELVQHTGDYMQKVEEAEKIWRDVSRIISGKTLDVIAIDGETVKVGDTYPVERTRWVEVVNIDAIVQNYANGEVPLQISPTGDYETCVIGEGGEAEIKGFTSDNKILFEYSTDEEHLGTLCPSGTQFLYDVGEAE